MPSNRLPVDHPLIQRAIERGDLDAKTLEVSRPARKRSGKYNATPTQDKTGRVHPSKLQARVTDRLRANAKAVIPEVSIPLSARSNDRIRIDALVIVATHTDGTFTGRFVEIKGMDLPTGVQKRRRFEDAYGVEIQVIKK
jgi:hypothetical protein